VISLGNSRIIRLFGSIWFWLFMAASSLVLYPIAAVIRFVTYPFDRRLTALHRFTCFWGSLYTWCNPFWQVTIAGKENLPGDTPHVIVANHQSFADILVFFRIRMHYKWVSKIENFRAPLVGWNMTLNRYIPIARGTMKGNLQMMRACEDALRGGNSIMMFPEGTRSPDGHMRPFKDGAFELALRAQCPILPVRINGTSRALPKRGLILEKSNITITILPPIPFSRFSEMPAREVNQMVWKILDEAASGNPAEHT
jgi:1-acyl-sn-glycerol-3-phosphate acyltransferase